MKILLITQYFWPENFIINDLVKELTAKGHEVKILTGKPNYPHGKIYKGYKQKGCRYDSFIRHNDIFRVPIKPRGKSFWSLIKNYFSFVINGLRYFSRELQGQKFDVIFSVAFSPVTSVIPAIFLKYKLKIPLVLWVQDLWPQSVKAAGYVRNPLILGKIRQLVKYIYKRSDLILMQSPAFKPFILDIIGNANAQKLIYYPNSFSCFSNRKVYPAPDKLIELLQEKFCVVFAGNIGAAQNIDIWLQTAKFLQSYPDINLVIVGYGSKRQELIETIQQLGLNNIITVGALKPNQMYDVYKNAELLLVTLKQSEALTATIPSKLQAYLAQGKPIVAAIDGEASRIINEAKAGFTVPAEDPKGLADIILKVYEMSQRERQELGNNARKYYIEHFEIKKQTQTLIHIIDDFLLQFKT